MSVFVECDQVFTEEISKSCQLEKVMSLRLNKVSTQDYIMQSLIETGTVVHVFLPFWYYIHLEKGMALHLKKNTIPFTRRCLVPNLVKI